jgi:mono/diheme cytochrome c family protein
MKMIKLFIPLALLVVNSSVLAGGSHAGGHGDHGSHKHDSWEKPPSAYSGKTWSQWNDKTIAKQGKTLYQQQCASCHGVGGKGDGSVSGGLAHKPADLTHHFHTAPGKGDDYLFWRISEGGTVAPFNTMQSSMPAFKGSLSESDRWAILTYIHQTFHGGFPNQEQHEMKHKH